MLERFVPLLSFGQLQKRQRRFVSKAGLVDTNQSLMALLHSEIDELVQALPTGDKKEIASEIADVFHLATRIADLNGINVRRAVRSKHERNLAKYNPRRIRRLQTEWGMTPDEAMKFAKSRWDKTKDRRYMR